MIHNYTLGGFHITLDVHSGAVHALDGVSAAVADRLAGLAPPLAAECPPGILKELSPSYPAAEIREAYGELFSLYEAGQLFSADDYGRFADRMTASPVKAMCLHVAHDCNLRCAYCFAGTGKYAGERSVMPVETGMRAVDFLIRHSGGRRNLEVDFFGGEPLLNFGLVREVVRYARSLEARHNKVFRFTITTNGVLLDDDKIDFINAEMSNVVLSLDGRREVNDRVRRRADGSGCYDAVLPKFQELVKRRGDGQYYVRGTFTRYNLDFAEDVLHLYRAGFSQISVEPVVAPADAPYALTEEHLPAVCAEYERLADILGDMSQRGEFLNFFHFMMDLDQGPCAIKRLRGCGCGNEYVAVTPDGGVYPCHQFAGMEGWKLGNLRDGSIDGAMKADFARATVYDKPECAGCWAKFYCSGGCNANNLQYGGSIRSPHPVSCALEKKRVECAILLKARERAAAQV